ncbi:sporulation integral membrane protein YtvI [Scopulibacillus darangshiensis]|uniref:Sporulation integral membrane protein YtvI n=1 Tax=Scopulibacillus darangshiensis TaxID=442528 RepID=A0A4R2PAS4_9BACL|nr:sporulation integral membrane protein YtvI [Scopulibacillus darangshiensis]TCP32092.1 sporulation integral membrane protein YtvI [Scopulibacillus darangshiensis]
MNSHYINNLLRYLFIFFRFIFVVFILFLIGVVLYYVGNLAYPFIIAFIISFLLNPIVTLIEKKISLPRWLATLVVIIIVFGLIAGLATLFVFELINGLTYLTNVVPDHVQQLIKYFQDFFFTHIIPLWERITHLFNSLSKNQQLTIQDNIQNVGQTAGNTLAEAGKSIISWLSNVVVSLPNLLTVLIFILLATFFICKDWHKLGLLVKKKTPPRIGDNIKTIYEDLKKALLGFIRAQLTLISITAVIVLIGLFILRVDHPVTIAVVTGIVDLMPYLGTGVVFVPWIIYSFFTGSYAFTIGLSVLYAIVIIQRQLMEPKILSSSIGLDPLATLISLFVGFKLFGFLGLIIGPVTLVIIKTLAKANVFTDIWNYILGKNTANKKD